MPHLQIWSIFLSQRFLFLSLQKAFSMFLKCVAFGKPQHNKPRSWVREFLAFFVETEQEQRLFSLIVERTRRQEENWGQDPPFYVLYTAFHTFYNRILSYFYLRVSIPHSYFLPHFLYKAWIEAELFLSKFSKLLFFGANHFTMKLSWHKIVKVRNFVFFCLASMLLVQM